MLTRARMRLLMAINRHKKSEQETCSTVRVPHTHSDVRVCVYVLRESRQHVTAVICRANPPLIESNYTAVPGKGNTGEHCCAFHAHFYDAAGSMAG